jgi:4-diphosphocytidyl-2-C-methyl-D-erythritol kinase
MSEPVPAYAKLTHSLRVTGVRADGYHEIDAVMTTVTQPCDTVTVVPARAMALSVVGPFAAGVPEDARNLAWRAAEAAGATVLIEIVKNIPHGAGLGGGSADAAAVLNALGADEALGATIGADVPFCMRGGAARVRGIGEIIEPISRPAQWIVIATPPFGCVTADVYRAWDELGGPHAEPNDLEPAAHHVEPRLAVFKAAIARAAGAEPFLAGSGSSYAWAFADEAGAESARAQVATKVDAQTWVGRTT